jgi:hypothetical protein
MTMTEEKPLLPLAKAAERRLGRLHVWASIRQRVTWIAGAAAASAALRPFVWPLQHQDPKLSALRALAFAAAGGAIITTVLIVKAWRSRPSLLTATRRIDDKLGLSEVVASGVAFEQANREDEMAAFAIKRARQAASDVSVKRLFTSEAVERPRFFKLMIAAAAIGLMFGAVDRLVVERALHPVTNSEKSAADALKKAAAEAKAPNSDPIPTSEQEKLMAEAAQRAAEATQRGDRAGAEEALEDMRKAERALSAENRDRAKSLRDLKDSLEAKQSTQHAGSASDALDDMQADLSKNDSAEMKALAERLEKAEDAARKAAEKAGASEAGKSGQNGAQKPGSSGAAEKSAWSKAAEALKEAREAAARGDKEGAKRAMEKAQKEIQKIEQASKRAGNKGSAASKMSAQASALDRSLRAGSEGKEAGEGKEPGDGNGKGSGEDGKDGKGKGSGAKQDGEKEKGGGGKGGGNAGDREPGAEAHRLKLNGDLQARADVKEGEKAISAIEGMGKGDEQKKAYKEIFPAYDTVVEDGLREDNVPAARRPTVRKYFQAIRPGEDSEEGKNDQ